MVFSTSDRSGAAYGVVQMPIAPSATARQIRTGQGGGIRRWVVARFAALPETSARADRVAVRVSFALGGSKMAGPKIAHVDMLAGCT